MTFVILSGGIDLSVGSIVAFCGIILAQMLINGMPIFLSVLICVFAGGIIGLVNGSLTSYVKIPAFIVTLGSMSVFRGIALLIPDGRSISMLPVTFSNLATINILSIPLPVYLFAIILALLYLFQNKTYWGHYIYAIGGNEKAAWLSGIDIKKYKTIVYIISGVMCAFSSIILVSRLGSAQPQAGIGYELDAIAAVVLGGASFSGGKGSIIGTLLGILIIGVLQNGMSILDVPSFIQQILIGAIIIVAVIMEKYNFTWRTNEK
jgi:ribose transport system permease protein